jgi:hypothetical protein
VLRFLNAIPLAGEAEGEAAGTALLFNTRNTLSFSRSSSAFFMVCATLLAWRDCLISVDVTCEDVPAFGSGGGSGDVEDEGEMASGGALEAVDFAGEMEVVLGVKRDPWRGGGTRTGGD